MLLVIPFLQLFFLVRAVLQRKAYGYHHVLLPLVFYFLQVLEVLAFPLAE